MGSTFSGIEMGKRSIMAHTDAITTAGHNISNADTEGYSRQRVELREFDPLYKPDLERAERPGQIGQGVDTHAVVRCRDEMLDQRITASQHAESYWDTRSKYYTMIEQIYNEPDEVSVRYNMDKFWNGWQELAMNPSETAARQAVVTRGESLANSIKAQWDNLMGIGKLLNEDIATTTKQVNDFTTQIADLNQEIVRVKAMGDNPNDLMDRRDLLVDKLSKLVNITSDRRDSDEFMVHLDGQVLVQGGAARHFALETVTDNNGYDKLVWDDGLKNDAHISGGVLGALIELRDKDIREQVQSLNTVTMNFSDLVNDVHRASYGMNNNTGLDFFTERPFVENAQGNYDSTGDGEFDKSYIFRFTGTTTLDLQQQIGLTGAMRLSGADGVVEVAYNPTDTVEAVINRINDSTSEVKAYLDRDSHLVLKASTAKNIENPDFVLRHVEDNGFFLTGYSGILAASGEGGAYDYNAPDAVMALATSQYSVAPIVNPSGYIEVNEALKNDVRSVGAAFLDAAGRVNAGDNRAAIEMAAVRNTQGMFADSRTLDDYFSDTVTKVALKGEQAENMHLSQNSLMNNLRDMRDSIMGVNIDEELADILKFQHGYNAAAKFVTVWDSLLDTVINRLKV